MASLGETKNSNGIDPMSNPPPGPVVFDQERAATYDERFAAIAPMRDTLHLLTRAILGDLPGDARVLCVGAGTGLEMLDLARAFPRWRFTAVEPAAPMLNRCREKAAEAGVVSRCTFHEGYLDSLPPAEPFDAATCVLVSHFLLRRDERRQFFHRIASRLRPGGMLVSADLAGDVSSPAYESLLEIWLHLFRPADNTPEGIEKMRETYRRNVAILPPDDVAAILASGGFASPVLFFQTLLVHAWYARRA
jgi:tRNA (cmo5U34)-methyltransferase